MIGLEGSGFTISIGVTLLLVGLVVFYFKQRMDEWDNKLQGMLNLNKALAASHAALEQRVMAGTYSTNNDIPVTDNVVEQSSPFDGTDVNNVVGDNRQVVSDDSSSDSDSDSDSDDSDSGEDNEDVTQMVIGSELNNDNNNSDGIKVVELDNGLSDNNQINLNGSEEAESLEEISLNTSNNNDDDDDDDDDDDSDDSDDETDATELTSDDITNNVAEMLNVKKVATEVSADLDFRKLNVGKLRELVVTRS